MPIPFKRHSRLDYWLSKPGAKLKNGCVLRPDFVTLWVDVPEPEKRTSGDDIGVDIGVDRLLVTSEGDILDDGQHKQICQKTARKKPGSKARKRAFDHRNNHIGEVVNRLPWGRLKTIVVEKLTDMKRGKKKGRGKSFRKALSPWRYRQVLTRIEQKAQEYGVLLVAVDPRNTSRECPACGTVSKENRKGAVFNCVSCGHSDNADKVGATNILRRYLFGSVRSLSPGCV
ncbi:MAG: hypothetical protein KatS3mg109_0094 [Pirellulaceae bacterium]|nr:MAG: hypothetical protein KatS3mg109_0094 [Pirellulaceae bacterium]